MTKFKYPGMKIKIAYLVLLFWISGFSASAQVGVNILTPHKTAAFQVESSNSPFRGLLTPTMTTANRNSIASGTTIPADGLMLFDKDHHMHYFYNGATNRWNSMSPLTLSTPSVGSLTYPNGAITTPNSLGSFQVGINKQTPSEALDVVGNATVSGNVNVGGNTNVTGNINLTGTINVPGFPPNALVPSGIIVMFSGTLIPYGWGLCDGGTYDGFATPDLRGRFIVGAYNYPGTINGAGNHLMYGAAGGTPAIAPNDGTTLNYGTIGNTGGETGHTLTTGEIPRHKHSLQSGIDGGNSSISATTVDDYYSGFGGNTFENGTNQGITNAAIIQRTHSHNLSGNSGDGTTSGLNNGVHENRPPYYVLAYIIKLP